MFHKKEIVAMLLAGGQGSRLYALTNRIAKPAVPFGAKYRIIDFPLSNCINSNIDTVGVLTQYQPLILNDYIGNGQPWDLDRAFGGVHILPPYQGKTKTDWYRGTANAIFQNIAFIKRYNPEYVLILSGDHIYKMDYEKMLAFHKQKKADITIAVIDVPIKEASRFGIMNTDQDNRIFEFEEKPAKPKSTNASMGIYIFSTQVLFDYLEIDENDSKSQNDFGKNIIPRMLADGKRLFAYNFNGYWKDVGTIDSLWEANMDLLGEKPRFDLFDPNWKIYARNDPFPPQYIMEGAVITNSLITVGCHIEGTVINSLLSHNVKVGKGAIVMDSVIFADTSIEEGASVQYSIVDERVSLKSHCHVGSSKGQQGKITVISSDVIVDQGMVVQAGEMIEKDVKR
ncbi:MAG TPA: glucose-1-phosphate adenylyltransferase [Bacilli bacterium]|nr:MAG: Glucose-1-phosphate adenylyltransferase [Tenericutes bacterium ADurb.BinA124]HNZ50809.1 glucose-1-phosphate adenylyltransferase [Bacilli bacterium]HPX84859.1 glucose-1-phosphate adenylyltransferase [Bacilli bacterium]HQC74889.1 glucose-1-phosphate adenylyltransferase [Bacilli bacterium]